MDGVHTDRHAFAETDGVPSGPGWGPRARTRLPCVVAGAISIAIPGPALAQPAPTMGISMGMQGYTGVKQPEGGLTAEVNGGVEWSGRTRLEIGATGTAQPGDCQLTCAPWHIETMAAFGELARLLGARDDAVRFVFAARAGYERLLTWDRDGFAAAGRFGAEFGLGRRTALSVMGFVGWATFEDPNPFSFGTDFTGTRLGLNIGLRVHPPRSPRVQ